MKMTKYIHPDGSEELVPYQIVEYPYTGSTGKEQSDTGVRVISRRASLGKEIMDPQDPRLRPFGGDVTLPSKINDDL
jgi:hypothetical protein